MNIEISKKHFILFAIFIFVVFTIRYIWMKTRRITLIKDIRNGMRISGIVTSVSDGDGFRFYHTPLFRSTTYLASDTKLKIRLAGIDAPETRYFGVPPQPLSKESKEYLSSLVLNKKVCLDIIGIDRYNRILAIAHIRRICYSINVNIEMIKSGLACVYKGSDEVFGKYKKIMEESQKEAMRKKLGIWGLDNMILPMNYKKMRRNENKS